MVADLATPAYKLELASVVPSVGMVSIVWFGILQHFTVFFDQQVSQTIY